MPAASDLAAFSLLTALVMKAAFIGIVAERVGHESRYPPEKCKNHKYKALKNNL